MKRFLNILSLSILLCTYSLCSSQIGFGPQLNLTDNSGGNAIQVADLDGDGLPDLVSANENEDRLSWKRNEGGGNYSDAVIVSSDLNFIRGIDCADLDGDGDIDLLSASQEDDKLTWFPNDGEGNFPNAIVISDDFDGASCILAVDLDGDEDLDLLCGAKNAYQVVWYENIGNGILSDQNIITSNALFVTAVYAADLDNDGDLDAISSSSADDKIAWYENAGNGSFSSEQIISTNADQAYSVHAKDLNGDGWIDVLSASWLDDKVAWYQNQGDGTFSSEQIISTEGNYARFVYAEDLDNDGDQDVLSASKFDDKVAWFINDGTGQFSTEQIITLEADDAFMVITADMDMDGDMDVLTSSEFGDTVALFDNLGDGNFSDEFVISEGAHGVYRADFGDLDNDGDLDVIAANVWNHTVEWFENMGNGEFIEQPLVTENAEGAIWVIAEDLNNDDFLDVVVARQLDQTISWHENLGNGSFSNEIIVTQNSIALRAVLGEDFDQDGDIDLVAVSNGDSKVAWFENLGMGVFSPEIVLTSDASQVLSVFVQDLDADGDHDILFGCGDGKIAWFENTSPGNFSEEHIISTEMNGSSCISSEDLDGDGDFDVITTAQNEMYWFKNNGNGTFTEPIFFADYGANVIHCNDMDDDGDFDIMISPRFSFDFLYYENLGAGAFGSGEVVSDMVLGNQSIVTGDVDNDGDPDILTASSFLDKISWYENEGVLGCLDPSACNYSSNVTLDNGSCCWGECGCTESSASNYNPAAECNDGSCSFVISGKVFFDENENGIQDNLNTELELPLQQLTLWPVCLTAWTNENGEFSFNVPSGNYQLELFLEDAFPFSTTTNPLNLFVEESMNDLTVGVSNEVPTFEVAVGFYTVGEGYPCDDLSNHNITFQNEGSVAVDGIIDLEIDSLFQDYFELSAIDSIAGNHIYMSFESLEPGQVIHFDIDLLTPTADFIGEFLTSVVEVQAFHDGIEVANGESELSVEITCAYDPNDKQVFPSGYEEPRFILNNTNLEYLIRFQNTGNAPATNVLITDTLDFTLDMSTFHLLGYSHPVEVILAQNDRVIEFLFEDIMLPDSTNNEPESHGFVSFTIDLIPGLSQGTEVNNTANIYFDNNPPIITNTTLNTIYYCNDSLAEIQEVSTIFCNNQEVLLENSQEYIQEYNWSINQELVGNEASISLDLGIGIYDLTHTATNPICEATNSINFSVVDDDISSSFNLDGNDLIAPLSETYQWYLNGVIIENANSQIYTIVEDGLYSLQITNSSGCSAFSEETFLIVGVHELSRWNDFKIYPNPAKNYVLVETSIQQGIIDIYDLSGRLIYSKKMGQAKTTRLDLENLENGVYQIHFNSAAGRKTTKLVVSK